MKGKYFGSNRDKWHYYPNNTNFQINLIKSASICNTDNNFIGIPCVSNFAKSFLSFSKCSSSKFMSYSALFINKNFKIFKEWILRFINSKNRWKIILVTNSNINTNIDWAYKFFPIPDYIVENWNKFSQPLISNLSKEAKNNNLIFFISAGPAANIIVSYLIKINNKNIYLDFGSAIEFITKGYSTRSYYINNSTTSKLSCQKFIIKQNTINYDIK